MWWRRLTDEAKARLKSLEPVHLKFDESKSFSPGEVIEAGFFKLAVDQRGAITTLELQDGSKWSYASAEHPIGLMHYQTFSGEDCDGFYKDYIVNEPLVRGWAVPDFTKPGIHEAGAVSGAWEPRLESCRLVEEEDTVCIREKLVFPQEPCELYGCPRYAEVEYRILKEKPGIELSLQWFEKAASRLPEAISYTFNPIVPKPAHWKMDKLGSMISPLEVVSRGSHRLHAVQSGCYYVDEDVCLALLTQDAPLVACGNRNYLRFDNRLAEMEQGFHFVLDNNLWGTNFRMWYEEDARFRFSILLENLE